MGVTDQRFTCVDCGRPSPALDEAEGSTLISVKYGWRIVRRPGESGERAVEARCPICWSRRRPSKTGA